MNFFDIFSCSLERIQGYIDIEHEPEATENGKPPAAWPTSGDLRVENLSARYSQVCFFVVKIITKIFMTLLRPVQ